MVLLELFPCPAARLLSFSVPTSLALEVSAEAEDVFKKH
jgi:hypothetical protein